MIIKGKTIKLYVNTQTGVDDFNRPIYTSSPVDVENVLIEPASNDAITSEYELYGKHIAYVLHIPKNDTNDWKDCVVEFYGNMYSTYGDCMIYDENMTPLSWNKKIKVERYE